MSSAVDDGGRSEAQPDPLCSVANMSQRFRFLDLVQKIARADVDQCTAALGLEALHGIAVMPSAAARFQHPQHHQHQPQQRPPADQQSTADDGSVARSARGDTNSNNRENSARRGSGSGGASHRHRAHRGDAAAVHQRPYLDERGAATIASRAAHEAAAAVLAEIKAQQAQLEQIRLNQLQARKEELAARKRQEDEDRHAAAAAARRRRSSQQQHLDELRTQPTEASPVMFRTVPVASAPAAPAAPPPPPPPQPQHVYHHYFAIPPAGGVNDSGSNNVSAAAATVGPAGASSPPRTYVRDAQTSISEGPSRGGSERSAAASSDRDAAKDSAEDRLARMMAEEERRQRKEAAKQHRKQQRERDEAVSASAALATDATQTDVMPTRASNTSPVDAEITAAAVASMMTQRRSGNNPVLNIVDDGVNNVGNGAKPRAASSSSRGNSPVEAGQQSAAAAAAATTTARRSSSPVVQFQDPLVAAAAAASGEQRRASSASAGRTPSSPATTTATTTATANVEAMSAPTTTRLPVGEGNEKNKRASSSVSDVITLEERARILAELDREQREAEQRRLLLGTSDRQKQQQQQPVNPMHVRGAVLRQLDDWLAKHDAFFESTVARHLVEAERAAAAYELRERQQRMQEQAEATAALAEHVLHQPADGGGDNDDDRRRLGHLEGVPASQQLRQQRTSPRKKRLFPRGFIPSSVRAELQEAGKQLPALMQGWEAEQLVRSGASSSSSGDAATTALRAESSSAALPTHVFCARTADQLLRALFIEVANEVDELCDNFVEGLVQHELQ